jgi:hypothetical protein
MNAGGCAKAWAWCLATLLVVSPGAVRGYKCAQKIILLLLGLLRGSGFLYFLALGDGAATGAGAPDCLKEGRLPALRARPLVLFVLGVRRGEKRAASLAEALGAVVVGYVTERALEKGRRVHVDEGFLVALRVELFKDREDLPHRPRHQRPERPRTLRRLQVPVDLLVVPLKTGAVGLLRRDTEVSGAVETKRPYAELRDKAPEQRLLEAA